MSTTADSPVTHGCGTSRRDSKRWWNGCGIPTVTNRVWSRWRSGSRTGGRTWDTSGKLHCWLLQDDVIRTFDDGYYRFNWWHSNEVDGEGVSVKPISAEEYYDIPKTMDAKGGRY